MIWIWRSKSQEAQLWLYGDRNIPEHTNIFLLTFVIGYILSTNQFDNKQIFQQRNILCLFCLIITNYSPEVINIKQHKAELNIILPRVNNFDNKQKRDGIFILSYATSTKNDLRRWRLTKHSKFRSQNKFFCKNWTTTYATTTPRKSFYITFVNIFLSEIINPWKNQ